MDDISGQTPVGFLLLFVLGFLMVADDRVTAAVDRQWWWALALGIAAMATRAALWPTIDGYTDPSWQDGVVNWLIYQVGLWMVIVGLLGLFHRYAGRRGGVYGYAAEAAYPFYILHQTVIVALAWFVVQWGAACRHSFTVIAVAAFFVTVAIYEVGVGAGDRCASSSGWKPRRQRTAAPASGRDTRRSAPTSAVPPAHPARVLHRRREADERDEQTDGAPDGLLDVEADHAVFDDLEDHEAAAHGAGAEPGPRPAPQQAVRHHQREDAEHAEEDHAGDEVVRERRALEVRQRHLQQTAIWLDRQ